MTENSAQRIVVGIDGSPSSLEALRWARLIAETTGATIDAMIAWDLPTMYGLAYLPADYTPEKDAGKVLDDTVDAIFGDGRPAGMQLIVKQGYAARVLLDDAEGAQMLIVGSRGHGGFAGLLLGSVSAHCAEHATCPVLVVHGHRDGEVGKAREGQRP